VALLLLSPFDEPLLGPIASSSEEGAASTEPNGSPVDDPSIGHIAYSNDDGIMTIEADGSSPRPVSGTLPTDRDPAWTRDGHGIAYERQGEGIWLATVTNDGDPEQITFGDDHGPAWSPVEEVLAFARGPARDRRIYILDRTAGSGSEPEMVWDTGEDAHDPAWSPDGLAIAFAVGFRLERDIAVGVLESPSDPVQISPDGTNDVDPAWSPDGQWIAFASSPDGRDFDLWRVRVDGTGMEQLTTGPETDHDPAWSPDGRAIVFTRADNQNAPRQLLVLRIETGDAVPITSGASDDGHPSWR
jgi:Tol biopolymer transport system component